MKRFFFGVLLALGMQGAIASPFFEGDVVAGVTSCRATLDGTVIGVVPAVNSLCRFDLGPENVSNGNHRAGMVAIVDDPVWGNEESSESFLDFVRPGPPAAPGSSGGLRIVR